MLHIKGESGMTNADIQREIDNKEAEIRTLRSELAANTSDIGDYRVIKIYEARLQKKDDPYNLEELLQKREDVRKRIDLLREEIENLKKKLK